MQPVPHSSSVAADSWEPGVCQGLSGVLQHQLASGNEHKACSKSLLGFAAKALGGSLAAASQCLKRPPQLGTWPSSSFV